MDLIRTDDKFPPGRVKRLRKLGKGITASAYLCRIIRGYSRTLQVLKITDIEDDIIYCHGQDCRGDDHREVKFGGQYEVFWTTQPHFKDGADTIIRTCSWRLERIVGRELQKANAHLPAPVFLPVFRGWTYKSKRYITMPYGGETLASLALPLKKLISVILQVLIALCWSQHLLRFKHHDLHSENVFIKFQKVPKIWALPDGTQMVLPDTGVRAIIADYGQSVINCGTTRYARADCADLNVGNKKWGSWNSILEGNEGYDMAVLIDSLQSDCEEPANLVFLNAVEEAAKSINFYRMSTYGRPYKNVGVTMLDLLRHPLFKCCTLSSP